MAYLSTLGSPGVEVHERDASMRISQASGTTIYIPGYASQGPVEEVNTITSIQDFENIYGTPTNAAESYFYYTVLAVLENAGNTANVLACRLPYGANEGDNVATAFSMLIYPTIPVYRNKNCKHYYPFYELKDAITVNSLKVKGTFGISSENDESRNGSETEDPTPKNILGDESLTKLLSGIENYDILDPTKIVINNLQLILNSTYQHGSIAVKQCKYAENNINFIFEYKPVKKELTEVDETYTYEETGDNDTNVTKTKSVKRKRYVYKSPTDVKSVYFQANVSTFIDKISKEDSIYTFKFGGVVERVDIIEKNDLIDSVTPIENVGILTMNISLNLEDLYDIENITNITFEKIETADGNTTTTSTINLVADHEAISTIPFGQVKSYQDGQLGDNVTDQNAYPDIKNYISLESFNWENNINTYLNGNYVLASDGTINKKEDSLIDNVTYLIGKPVTYQVSFKDYYDLITNTTLKWSSKSSATQTMSDISANNEKILEFISGAAFVVFNTSRSIVNENFEGFYLGLTDNIFNEPNDDYNAITGVKATTKTCDKDGQGDNLIPIDFDDFHNIPENQLDFYTESNNSGSMSQIIQNGCTTFNTNSEEYDDTLSMILFKLNKSTTSNNALKLSYSVREKYNASLGKSRVQGTINSMKPVSYFIENVTKDSSNLLVIVNPTISNLLKTDINGNLTGKVRIASKKLEEGLKAAENEYLVKAMSINEKAIINKKLSIVDLAENCLKNYENVCLRAGMNLGCFESIINATENTIFDVLNDIYPLGVYTVSKATNKIIGNTPYKLKRALTLVENDEEYPDIDILVNGGLSTIYAYSNSSKAVGDGDDSFTFLDQNDDGIVIDENNTQSGIFNDEVVLQGIEDLRTARSSITEDAQRIINNFVAVENEFMRVANSYTQGGRNDTFYINDTLRGILIKGKDTKIEKLYGTPLTNNVYSSTDHVNHSWSTSIYWPHKHLYNNVTSSYTSAYAQWFKINDYNSDDTIWVPASGYIAGMMASTDANYGPWYAVGGLRRGIVPGVLDCAVSPTTKQRSDLYKICINSIPKLTGYGPTVWGIRTLSKVASAMDQNTCRRTILQIIKTVKRYLRYYVFESNDSFTRLACYNEIDPYLADQVAKGSIYAYKLIIDTSNNTSEVINNGEMAVDISVQPTRTAENIVLTITANKYSADITTATFNAD